MSFTVAKCDTIESTSKSGERNFRQADGTEFVKAKDYCITGRANPISCAVGLC